MSTFYGLEMAKQSLFTQQSALHTTGHNISNANTKGYSRQRVNFETMSPYPSASRNRPEMPGQLGTGVKAGSIERVRNEFLDNQYRSENSQSSYWEAKSGAMDRLESLMNEPADSGISASMEKFWESLQDLAANPTNSGAQSVVAERGQALADTFNYTSNSISSFRDDLKTEISHSADTVNSLLNRINEINDEIKRIEPHGYLPNDLYDHRDRKIDELSEIIDIDIHTSGSDNPQAEGAVGISLAGTDQILLDTDGTINSLNISFTREQSVVDGVTFNGQNVLSELSGGGSLKGNIDTYGYMEDDEIKGSFHDIQTDLDKMVQSLGDVFNDIHDDPPFFTFDADKAAGTIAVSSDIRDDPSKIMTSDDGYGDIASQLADAFSKDRDDLGDTSINAFFEGMIGRLGVEAQEANTMRENSATLKNQVENQRMSVSAVSLDEEMSNMIKFQHAYNAAARGMTAVDEMLDRIINNMGLVGR